MIVIPWSDNSVWRTSPSCLRLLLDPPYLGSSPILEHTVQIWFVKVQCVLSRPVRPLCCIWSSVSRLGPYQYGLLVLIKIDAIRRRVFFNLGILGFGRERASNPLSLFFDVRIL
ncbi:hypothetical protein M5689_012688 [Euphorbia peplus]|nr:hypothetical protein M5689_012688 [Euphorbia peplus]